MIKGGLYRVIRNYLRGRWVQLSEGVIEGREEDKYGVFPRVDDEPQVGSWCFM